MKKNDVVVLILAACGRRFEGKLRQFLRIGRRTLLDRLERQLKEWGHEAIVVSHLREIQETTAQSFVPAEHTQGSDTLLSTATLWGNRVIVLVSDAVFSDEAIRLVFEDDDSISIFGKAHELFAFAFDGDQANRIKKALEDCYLEAPDQHVAWKWRFYRTLCGISVLSWRKDDKFYKAIAKKDYTSDFDHLHEYETFLKKRPWASEDMTAVYISGCWDLFHAGHLSVLKRAKELGDFLVVGVNTDELAQTYKGETAMSFKERLDIIDGLDFVDAVVPHRSLEDLTGIIGYDATIRAVGPEWGQLDGQRKALEKHIKDGVEIVELPRTPGVCTTLIKERIKNEAQDCCRSCDHSGCCGLRSEA